MRKLNSVRNSVFQDLLLKINMELACNVRRMLEDAFVHACGTRKHMFERCRRSGEDRSESNKLVKNQFQKKAILKETKNCSTAYIEHIKKVAAVGL